MCAQAVVLFIFAEGLAATLRISSTLVMIAGSLYVVVTCELQRAPLNGITGYVINWLMGSN
jgi:hypothetical protein